MWEKDSNTNYGILKRNNNRKRIKGSSLAKFDKQGRKES